MNRLKTLAAAALATSPLLATAQTWDLARDLAAMDPQARHPEAWDFFWNNGLGQGAPAPVECNAALVAAPLRACRGGAFPDLFQDVAVVVNTGSTTASFKGATLPGGAAALQGGGDGHVVAARWTAPAEGDYHIEASFSGLAMGHAQTVFIGWSPDAATPTRTLAWVDGLPAAGGSASFDRIVHVAAGAAWDFDLQPNVPFYVYADPSDPVLASIRISAVPELPTSLTWPVGLAALALLRWRRTHGRPSA